jgi:hypothetical protein
VIKKKCEIKADEEGTLKEFTTFECVAGYEINPKQTEKTITIETIDGHIPKPYPFQCIR